MLNLLKRKFNLTYYPSVCNLDFLTQKNFTFRNKGEIQFSYC